MAAEVMNFGVGGYGNDQAYLRWKHVGAAYRPAVVLIGFQAENCLRNLNVIRKFYSRETGIPFSKPRFVLEDGALELVNAPTIDYRRLPDEVAAFETSPLRPYETFYDPRDYQPRFLGSLLISVISDRLSRPADRSRYYGPVAEELCFRIIERFVVEASGQSAVFVVHLPKRIDLERLAEGGDLPYAPLLARLGRAFRVLDPAEALIAAAGGDLRVLFQRHYTARGNFAVAAAVAEGVARAIRAGLGPAGGHTPRE